MVSLDGRPRASALRVLLVEDDDASRELGAELLRAFGHLVDIAEDGAVAVTKALAHPFDVILMDCQLPVMDGLEATRRIRQAEMEAPLPGRARRLRVPIVALTARTVRGEREICIAAGMDDHVGKPIDAPRLLAVLDRYGNPPIAETDKPDPVAPPPSTDDREIDDVSFLSRCLGKPALALKVLDKVETGMPEMLAALRAAAARGEGGPPARAAHSLKGLAGNIAAMQLHAAVVEFEVFLRAAPTADAAELTARADAVAAAVNRCLADLPRARAALSATPG